VTIRMEQFGPGWRVSVGNYSQVFASRAAARITVNMLEKNMRTGKLQAELRRQMERVRG